LPKFCGFPGIAQQCAVRYEAPQGAFRLFGI